MGDWLYLVHSTASMEKFQSQASKSGKGGAASGWNLVCVEGGGVNANKYLGFGMSHNAQGMTLSAIKNAMIKECGGDPNASGWDMYLHFRIRPNIHGLRSMVEKALSL